MAKDHSNTDFLIAGGGFYGCALALFLRSLSKNVTLVEAEPVLLNRASRINQARIHTGFHYPRSPLTAVKSMVLHRRFVRDFAEAVVDDFQMIYAIARNRSKVSAKRFYAMYRDIGAPIALASPSQTALFNPDAIEGVFACKEHAFDYVRLRALLAERLEHSGVRLHIGTTLQTVSRTDNCIIAGLSDGREVTTQHLFNVTYGQTNHILRLAGLPEAPLKYEIVELALVDPPDELRGSGVTIMDGAFFSLMPYPAEQLYSLTHVRYSPHVSWNESMGHRDSPYTIAASYECQTRVKYMVADARRFLPCVAKITWKKSLYEVKTVLMKNEGDDGRPILYQRHDAEPRITAIVGGKLDNIYDLFDLIRMTGIEWADTDECIFSAESRS